MKTIIPTSMMVWTVNDAVIESQEERERQFHDILQKKFEGIAVFVRCSRYAWDHKSARAALGHIEKLCRKNGLHFWIGPDPRFISRRLIKNSTGLPVVLYGNRIKATEVPHFAPVIDNKFNLRCEIPSRSTHMLREVDIEYAPAGLLRVYAVPDGQSQFEAQEVVDITEQANFFFNARERYLEAFGSIVPPDNRPWKVTAFFHVYSSMVDFSNARQLRRYLKRLDKLADEVKGMDLFMWDEPGYTCVYGALPFSKSIARQFRQQTGLSLRQNLWQLALDCADGRHVSVRTNYFRIVQDSMIDAQRFVHRHVKKTWGKRVLFGIHDTWHFESADMCDMNHGSLDLWQSLPLRSGGFVDLGGVNQLRDPESDYYDNLAAMSVIAKSLGRYSEKRFAFNNLWTVDDDEGEGWQTTVMEHCVNVMALFGLRWLAHCYGPVGIIGEEERFLGSPPLPGYPHHSTWPHFKRWNQMLKSHFAVTQGVLPWANVLLVFPIESLYALAGVRANDAAQEIFALLRTLLDAHYHLEVVSTTLFAKGKWRGDEFRLKDFSYDAVIFPNTTVVPQSVRKILEQNPARTLTPISSEGRASLRKEEVVDWLEARPELRPVKAPAHCWISICDLPDGKLITLAPARHGAHYQGELVFGETQIDLAPQTGLCRVMFPRRGEAYRHA